MVVGGSEGSPVFTQPLSVMSKLDTFRSLALEEGEAPVRSGVGGEPLHTQNPAAASTLNDSSRN